MSYFAVGLTQPKNPMNVGSVLRSAQCFGASMVATSGARYRKVSTDTMNATATMPLIQVDNLRYIVPYDCVPVAIERSGEVCLSSYRHPKRALYVFGPEDGDIPESVTSWCRDIVSIPCGCLNLAMAVSVVLYDRISKELRHSFVDRSFD